MNVTASESWQVDASSVPSWLTVSPMSGAAGNAQVTFSAESTKATNKAEVKIVCAGQTQYVNVIQYATKVDPPISTAAQVIAGDDGVTFRMSGVCSRYDSGNANASRDGFPLRLVLARQDVRVKEFVFCNSFGVEDRVYSSGRSNPKLEGASVAFLNGAVEQELRNDATEGREVFSGYLGSARESALWLDFLKAHERHILLSRGLARIIVDTQETDLQDNKRELCVLRTLGFQFREISRSRFFRALLQFVVAFIVGLIPGTAVAKYTLLQLSTPDETFLFVSGIFELAVTALPVFAYILFSHFASMHSMKKWNAAEVVKEKE